MARENTGRVSGSGASSKARRGAPQARGRGGRRPVTAGSRQPTYESGDRLVRMFVALLQAPQGREQGALATELEISTKTVRRYTTVLQQAFFDDRGEPLLQISGQGDRRRLRLAREEVGGDANLFEAAAMFFSNASLRALRTGLLDENVEQLWERHLKKLPADTRRALDHLERRFVYVPFAPKDYSKHGEVFDKALSAVVRRKELAIRYRKPGKPVTRHLFKPYTLLLYRDALYLLGESNRHRKPIYLALDRIENCERTGSEFSLPRDYDPAALTRGVFGIWEGPESEVVLKLRGRAAEQMAERRIDPRQIFERTRGGDAVLKLRTRGWQELAWWILSYGQDVEVVAPPELRAYVAAEVRGAARRYAREEARA